MAGEARNLKVRIDHVSKVFDSRNGRTEALRDVSLEIAENEIIEKLSSKCAPKRLSERLTADGTMEALPTDFETPLPPYDTAHCPLEADTPDENNWKRPKLYKLKPEERPIDFAEVAKGNVDF